MKYRNKFTEVLEVLMNDIGFPIISPEDKPYFDITRTPAAIILEDVDRLFVIDICSKRYGIVGSMLFAKTADNDRIVNLNLFGLNSNNRATNIKVRGFADKWIDKDVTDWVDYLTVMLMSEKEEI